jgi:hypothetical protein
MFVYVWEDGVEDFSPPFVRDARGTYPKPAVKRKFKNQTTMDDASSNPDEIWEAMQRSAEPLPIRAGEWQGDNGESYHHGESSPTAYTYPSSPPTRAGGGTIGERRTEQAEVS